ncbi:MAG: class I SAM-dependent methyltransferase [Candidatus Diapherotrites archaeon]|nr:class I SAM-dependent methyltransferase [Candidatus Diapherotrites archaeon]
MPGNSGYYAAISPGYSALHAEEQLAKAELIKKSIPVRGLLLDIGAGTGVSTAAFEKSALCVALDPCREMLKRYKGLRVVGKAEQLPFKSSSFDCVVSVTALHHADLRAAKRELLRVTKPLGSVAVSFFKRAEGFKRALRIFSGFSAVDAGADLLFFLKRINK